MRRVVPAVLAGLFLSSCIATHVGGGIAKPAPYESILKTAETTADSLFLREMGAFVKIVDADFWRDHLRHASDLPTFRADLEDYFNKRDFASRPDTPDRNEWREDMEKRLEWCRTNLSTPIDAAIPDVRWELVLRHGVPSAAWRTTTRRPIGTRGAYLCVVYNMAWHELGLAVSCDLSELGNLATGYGPLSEGGWVTDDEEVVEITPSQHASMSLQETKAQVNLNGPSRFVAFPGLKQIIHSNVAPLIFPNEDGTSDLWLATLTRGDQFSDSTIHGDRFAIQLSVYDSSHRVTGRDSVSIQGLSQIANDEDRKRIALPGYVGCRRLPPGEYEFVVSLNGHDPANLGVYRGSIMIPTARALRGASDVVIAFAPGTATGRGIERNGRQWHANPSGSIAATDSLRVYVEFPVEQIPGEAYRVTVSLIPKRSAIFRPWVRTDREKTLYSSVLPRRALGGAFQETIALAAIGSGQYFLSVQIASQLEEPEGENSVMAWTEIEVK